jgi:hypothetical protein
MTLAEVQAERADFTDISYLVSHASTTLPRPVTLPRSSPVGTSNDVVCAQINTYKTSRTKATSLSFDEREQHTSQHTDSTQRRFSRHNAFQEYPFHLACRSRR